MKNNPWYKASFKYSALGSDIQVDVPQDVFSTLRIDEGTLLFLDYLPQTDSKTEPKNILDMGCGYGALSLPIAAKYPEAQFDLVDRDLLAVEWANANAIKNQLKNITAFGSLGFKNVLPRNKKYDWILCNIPARIGQPFIQNFLETGRSLLTETGEIRIVIIRDLEPVLEPITEAKLVFRGPRHSIFCVTGATSSTSPEPFDLYLRDQVVFEGKEFDRPYDLGGDDPKRLKSILPLLWDALPRREVPKTVVCFRNYYGILPLMIATRWPDTLVTTIERDLLSVEFTHRNALKHGLKQNQLKMIQSPSIWTGLETISKTDFMIGELSPSAGEKVHKKEIESIRQSLKPSGYALVVCLDKNVWDPSARIMSRDGYSVVRIQQ